MGKLTTNQQQQIGTLVVSAYRDTVMVKEVTVVCTDKSAGQVVHGILSAAYPKYSFDKADSIWGNVLAWGAIPGGSWTTGNWQTFRVRTGSKSQANDLVKVISQCIDKYGIATDETYTGSDDTGGNGIGSRLGNSSLYLIIGAVLAVVLAIVLTRKRK